jgi:hypothetical protein
MHNGEENQGCGPLLNVRSALILLMSFVAAVLVGWLTFVATRNLAQGAVAAIFAFGGSVLFGMKVVS